MQSLVKLQVVTPIPRFEDKDYLAEINIPEEYLDALCRELLRNDFNSGAWLRDVDSNVISLFKAYVVQTVLLRYKLSLASYITKHPYGSSKTEREGVNLRSEVVFRLVDLASALPTVNKLLQLVTTMFPVIKWDRGVEILPLLPTRAEMEAHYDEAARLYNENNVLASLVRNTLAPSPSPSVAIGGYPALCGLSRPVEGELFFIPEFEQPLMLGWPHLWGVINADALQPYGPVDVANHYHSAFVLDGVIPFNLASQGRLDGTAVVAGKIRGNRGSLPMVPEPFDKPITPAGDGGKSSAATKPTGGSKPKGGKR